MKDVIEANKAVLSSYKIKSYRTDTVLKNSNGESFCGKYKCVAGQGGICNHVAEVLHEFGLFGFQQTMNDAPESCTLIEQIWHQPSRQTNKVTIHSR